MGLFAHNYEVVDFDGGERRGVLLDTETHHLFEISDYLHDCLRRDPSAWPAEAEAELVRLRERGVLAACNHATLAACDPLDGATLALNINLTAFCNLGCTYCFAEGGDYGRLTGKLSRDVDVAAILAFIEAHAGEGETVRFEFFGGEPMMNFEVIEELCNRSREMSARLGIAFVYRISTNLTTRMSERELGLFERFGFIVSVSIDGGATTHDRNRPTKAGRGSQAAILANCRKVRARSEAITLVARMTYVPYRDTSLLADVRLLHGENIFDWFQILPAAVAAENHHAVYGDQAFAGDTPQAVSRAHAEKITCEFDALYAEYLSLFSSENRFRGMLEVETVIRMIERGECANGFCNGGRSYFTFSPDKSIMPCHRLVGDEAFQVGDFTRGVDESRLGAWRKGVNETPVCRDCSIRYLCGGGCKQENHLATGEMNSPDPDKCAFQFALVRGAVRIMAAGGEAFRRRDREALSRLFVSCGRPLVANGRSEVSPDPDLEHLRLLV